MDTNYQALKNDPNLEIATLGTGCFWCTEAIFDAMAGVKSAVSGYAGGHVENPTYEEVCGKQTGHVECVEVIFDPKEVSYEDLLEVFWRVHDPTTKDRQGNDVGPQYHSTIFYHNEQQKAAVEKSLAEVSTSGLWPDPIVTTIRPIEKFYVAEDYHQQYFDRVGTRNPYCTFVVKPKVDKFKKAFKDKLKP